MKNIFPPRVLPYCYFCCWCLSALSAGSVAATGQRPAPAEDIYRGISDDLTPELAKDGQFAVGVKTLPLVNPQQFDIASGGKKDRRLLVELWYPAKINKKIKQAPAVYDNVTRSHKPFSLRGKAYRDAPPLSKRKFPLVVVSHGYTGYRTLMFYLGEHLASHGYVVAAIDHTDSTNAEIDIVKAPYQGFPSTLYNRSRDQQFVLDALMQHDDLNGMLQADAAGLIGYSMGGYGALNTIGACYKFSPAVIGRLLALKETSKAREYVATFNSCAGGQYQDYKVDARWRAAMVLAPWGNHMQIYDPEAVSRIAVPLLMVAGNLDDISHYQSNVALFNSLQGISPAYFLTYLNARHNVAGHPAPHAARDSELDMGFHWEASWNTEQINTINEHFALAMMDCYIKKHSQACDFLNLREEANQVVIDGKLQPPWKGFPPRFSTGMTWRKK